MFSRKVISIVLVLTLVITCFVFSSSAETVQNLDLANKLKTLNLFLGSDVGFELDKDFTREQSVVMILRLQALEKTAKDQNLKSLFTDVPSGNWAESYIAYANKTGITVGIGDNKFGFGSSVTANQYVTYILRALGYDDTKGDFIWDKSIDKALEVGLLTATEVKYFKTKASTSILRDDVVALSYNALKIKLKGSEKTLLRKLMDSGSVTMDQVIATRDDILSKAMMATPTNTATHTPAYTSTPTPTPTAVRNAYGIIEAETFNSKSGVETGACTEGGQDIEWIENGDYAVYNGFDFGYGASVFEARVASGSNGGKIEIRLDSINGKVVGTCSVTSTGGWQSWVTRACSISGATGRHNVYLRFTGGSGYLFSLNWFKFTSAATPTPTGAVFSDNFNDGNAEGWLPYGGIWSVDNKQYSVNPNSEGKSIVYGKNFVDFTYSADVTVGTTGNAGLIFDVLNPAVGTNAFNGYYVGIDANNGRMDLLRMSSNTATTIANVFGTINPYTANKIKVVRSGNSIKVYLNDMNLPKIDTIDSSYLSGAIGVRAVDTHAVFDNISVNLYSASSATPTPTPTPVLRNPDNPGYTVNGLNYKYYEGYFDVLPNFNSVSVVKSGTVNNFDIGQNNREDNFAFSFAGYINITTGGEYTFYTTSDDGSRLYIGSQLVVDNDGEHGMTEKSGTIKLATGKHAITVNFFDSLSDHSLEVRYSGPGVAKTLIPDNVLFRSAPTPTPTSTLTPTPTSTSTPVPTATSTPTNTAIPTPT